MARVKNPYSLRNFYNFLQGQKNPYVNPTKPKDIKKPNINITKKPSK